MKSQSETSFDLNFITRRNMFGIVPPYATTGIRIFEKRASGPFTVFDISNSMECVNPWISWSPSEKALGDGECVISDFWKDGNLNQLSCNSMFLAICQIPNFNICETTMGNCSEGWLAVGKRCYKSASLVEMNYEDGVEACGNMESTLPIIQDAVDFQNFLSASTLLVRQWVDVWLPISDINKDGYFQINDPSAGKSCDIPWTNWITNQPKNSVAVTDCAYVEKATVTKLGTGWSITECSDLRTVICEKSPASSEVKSICGLPTTTALETTATIMVSNPSTSHQDKQSTSSISTTATEIGYSLTETTTSTKYYESSKFSSGPATVSSLATTFQDTTTIKLVSEALTSIQANESISSIPTTVLELEYLLTEPTTSSKLSESSHVSSEHASVSSLGITFKTTTLSEHVPLVSEIRTVHIEITANDLTTKTSSITGHTEISKIYYSTKLLYTESSMTSYMSISDTLMNKNILSIMNSVPTSQAMSSMQPKQPKLSFTSFDFENAEAAIVSVTTNTVIASTFVKPILKLSIKTTNLGRSSTDQFSSGNEDKSYQMQQSIHLSISERYATSIKIHEQTPELYSLTKSETKFVSKTSPLESNISMDITEQKFSSVVALKIIIGTTPLKALSKLMFDNKGTTKAIMYRHSSTFKPNTPLDITSMPGKILPSSKKQTTQTTNFAKTQDYYSSSKGLDPTISEQSRIIGNCKNKPCYGDALCEQQGRSFKCHCSEGFYGYWCQLYTSSCNEHFCYDYSKKTCLTTSTLSEYDHCLNRSMIEAAKNRIMSVYQEFGDKMESNNGMYSVFPRGNLQSSVVSLTSKEMLIYAMNNQASSAIMRSSFYKNQDMLIRCTYNGAACKQTDWTENYHALYGMCHTFNKLTIQNGTGSGSRSGIYGGLQMDMDVRQETYLDLSETGGIKLTVHEPDSYPFAEFDGLSLSPRYSVEIRIRQILKKTDKDPNKNCNWEVRNNSNGYFYPRNYSTFGCERSQLQSATVNRCGCGNPKILVKESDSTCVLEKKLCVDETETYFDLSTTETCTQSCKSYEYTIASTRTFQKKNLASICQGCYEQPTAKIYVFFDTLTYVKSSSESLYPILDLFTDFGNYLGLFVGMSIVSIVELIFLALESAGIAIKTLKK